MVRCLRANSTKKDCERNTNRMINRTMVRTRVVQTLFAFYQDGDKTSLTAQKELGKSFDSTYDLYMVLLDFVNELTAYAEGQIAQAEARAKVLHTDYVANRRFVENRFARQIFGNRALRNHLDNYHLDWNAGMNATTAIYKQLLDSRFYKDYMSAETCTYDDDKKVWRSIFESLIPESEAMLEALDEMEVVLDRSNWTTDLNVVLCYVIKTIKRFKEDSAPGQELLKEFDSNEELSFAQELLGYAIRGHEEYENLINSHLKNWDAERIAYMDRIILEVALAEILNFPNIALEVSFNEYIELGKEYSGEKSYIFINGILNEILREMKQDNTLVKAVTLK